MARKKAFWMDNNGNAYPTEAEADEAIAEDKMSNYLDSKIFGHNINSIKKFVLILRSFPNEIVDLLTESNPRWKGFKDNKSTPRP